MYATSQDYKDRINSLDRVFKLEVRIEHSTGTLVLDDKDIVQGSFHVNESSQSGDEFTLGGTVGSDMEISILKIPEYEDIDFIGAKIVPTVGIFIEEGVDAHFIQSYQASKMPDFEEKWEYVPLGQFNIDIADKTRNTVNIRAIDNMIFLDRLYDMSNIGFPSNLKTIYLDLCSSAGITPKTISFVNDSYIVKERPVGEFSHRNILGFIAELSGSFASFNRNGSLELKWYEETGVKITPDQRSKLEIANTPDVQITGISIEDVVPKKVGVDDETGEDIFEDENVTYLAGTETYVLDLTDNPLLKDNYDIVLNNILTKVSTVKFRPYTSDYSGNPALEPGDIITQIDIDDNVFKTVITHSKYKYRGTCSVEAKAISNVMRGFKSTDNRIVSILKRVEENLGDKINGLQQAQISGTEMIANTLGGYVTNVKNESDPNYLKFKKGIFIHDSVNLATSTKIWKWGLGGFGFSDDGGLTFTTGITADSSIYANLITASMIQSGVLRSLNGNSIFDLDNGTFKLGTQFVFDGTTITFGDNVNLSWGNIEDKPSIPTTPSDIGALPATWTPTWGDIGNKPFIPSSAADVGAKSETWLPNWSDIISKPFIPNDLYITNITKTTVTTSFINALGITAKYIAADAVDGKTIRGASIIGGMMNIGDGALKISSLGNLQAGGGGFSVPWNSDGVYNQFTSSDTGKYGARWKADDRNYIYQDTSEARFYIRGKAHHRFELDGDHTVIALGATLSAGSQIKSLGGSIRQVQFRNGYDTAYIPIGASDFQVGSSETLKENIKLCESKLDVVKNTPVYSYNLKEPIPIEEVVSMKSTFNLKDNVSQVGNEVHTGFISEESPDDITTSLGDVEGISLYNTVGVLWKAVQELNSKVELLEVELKK